jgi:hypothetical protein
LTGIGGLIFMCSPESPPGQEHGVFSAAYAISTGRITVA